MVKYMVFDSGSDASRLMFADVNKMPNAIETSNIFSINTPFLRALNKVHMSGKINRKVPLPFRKIWDSFYLIEKAKKDKKNEYIVFMTNVSAKKFRVEYLQDLKKYKNIHLVLIAVDSFVDQFLCPLGIMEKVDFDLIYSFDRDDCAKYGLLYTQSQYSKMDDVKAANVQYDLFFIGRAKDRLEKLKHIVRKANSYGLRTGFFLLGVPKKQREKIDGITYLDRVMPYREVLPLILSSKCLVDIVQEGQKGLTMRVYEAIFYNKKLYTNNESIRNLRYYDPRYMMISSDLENVEEAFFGDTVFVDYKYENDYSPIVLLKDAEQRIFGEN